MVYSIDKSGPFGVVGRVDCEGNLDPNIGDVPLNAMNTSDTPKSEAFESFCISAPWSITGQEFVQFPAG